MRIIEQLFLSNKLFIFHKGRLKSYDKRTKQTAAKNTQQRTLPADRHEFAANREDQ